MGDKDDPTPIDTLDDIRAQLRAELPTLRERCDVDRLGICGSYVRGEQTEDGDLDLLVTFTETPDLFKFVGLKLYLEEGLGLSVDLGTPGGLGEGPAAENIRREVEYLTQVATYVLLSTRRPTADRGKPTLCGSPRSVVGRH